MYVTIDPTSIDDYRMLLKIKKLPTWRIEGRQAWFPDEYADRLGMPATNGHSQLTWTPSEFLFDYQTAITQIAIRKRKFAIFADCGLGKTLIFLEYAQHAQKELGKGKRVLIVSPLMVVSQTISEARRWYPSLDIEQVAAADLQSWLDKADGRIGITNYEAIRPELASGKLGALILDESSMLKSHYGKWGTKLIELGRGLDWKLAGTGTPAPNDRIEYANHAVFLDAFPTVNSFLATYFVNRGQTNERWELKAHALESFYRALSHWCIFLTCPRTYGWTDNTDSIPPINVHIHDVPMTDEQTKAFQSETNQLFPTSLGGITTRAKLGQIAKGSLCGKELTTHKPRFVRQLVESWPDESTIIWCIYNREQDLLERVLPEAISIRGETPLDERLEGISAFQAGRNQVLISKPKVLGFGLNLQVATRQIFSGLQDSYESYYQAVKRSNRIGSTRPLNVHIPVTELEEPMVANVLRKAANVQQDTEAQERIFKECSIY